MFAYNSFSFNWAYLQQIFLTKFSELIDMCMGMITLTFVLRSPKVCCYGNQLTLAAI